MEDRVYNVRIHFNHGNAMNLDLKGCGTLYIKPGKDYYFINAPINFINYLAQLKRCGVTYEITENKRGCYQEIDLSIYNINDPRYLVSLFRKDISQKKVKEVKEPEPRHVVLSSDDKLIVNDNKKINEVEKVEEKQEVPAIPPMEINIDPTNDNEVPKSEEVKEEDNNKIYTDSELQKFGKVKLLEIANNLGLENISDINTKKEIREAILAAQK